MTKELLQQCLKALLPHGSCYGNGKRPVEDAAIEALKQALAQQDQPAQEEKLPEFFAELEYNAPDFDVMVSVYRRKADAPPELFYQQKLPDQKPADQPAQEPLSDTTINELAFKHGLVPEGCWSEDCIAFANELIEAHIKGGAQK